MENRLEVSLVNLGQGLQVLCAVGLAAGLVAMTCCRRETPAADPFVDLASALPTSILAWDAQAGDQIYDDETIFSYIDGHAEVYLAYNMKSCLSRRYEGPDSALVVDVFEMASPEDAFGVFTHDLDGEEMGLGQGSRLRYGWLSMWKGRHFVSIYSEVESEESAAAVLQLGAVLDAAIVEQGELPAVVRELPGQDLDRGSIRFLHSPQILGAHLVVGQGNPFDIDSETPTVLATYRRGEGIARVLVVDYPDEARARAVAETLDGALRIGNRMAVAVEFTDQQLADEVLAAMAPPTEGEIS